MAKKRKSKINQIEHSEQARVIKYMLTHWPDIEYHVEPIANRYMLQRSKALGYRPYHPDIFIYEPRRGYAGFAIELKKFGTGIYKLSTIGSSKPLEVLGQERLQGQHKRLKNLEANGFLARFVVGYDEAIAALDWYLGKLKPN